MTMSEVRTIQQLARIGVKVLEPTTRQQAQLATAMADFATYCLHDEQQSCRALVEKHMALAESNNDNDQEDEASSPSSSIGELQGGSDEFDIYRLSFPPAPLYHDKNVSHHDDDTPNAAMELLQAFVTSPAGKPYRNGVLTFESMRRYMLEMCQRRLNTPTIMPTTSRRRSEVTRLVNVMLILAFGPTPGQPRHVDHMHPNVSIFLSMSQRCPSTIIYDTTTPTGSATTTTSTSTTSSTPITNTKQLVQYWQEQCGVVVPTLLQTILNRHGSTNLHCRSSSSSSSNNNDMLPQLQLGKHHHHHPFVGAWDTIDSMLQHFGQLYQSISARPLSLPDTRPGTTLIVGGAGSDGCHYGENHCGNYVHAGPSTSGPRMLCFAVGILNDEEDDDQDDDNILHVKKEAEANDTGKKENDGEVQYNPVLFHVDLCCILFSIMDHNCHHDDADDDCNLHEDCQPPDNNDELYQSKWFLIHDVLVPLVKGLCHDRIAYERLLGNERIDLRDWLQRLTAVFLVEVEPHHEDDYYSPVQIQRLVQEAITSKRIFCCCSSPDSLLNNKSAKKKLARRQNKPGRRGRGKKEKRDKEKLGG